MPSYILYTARIIRTVIPWEKDRCFLITAFLFSYKVSDESSNFKGIGSRDELALSWPGCWDLSSNKGRGWFFVFLQESIPLAYVAWRAGTSNRVVIPARQAGNRFPDSLKSLQIRAQNCNIKSILFRKKSINIFFLEWKEHLENHMLGPWFSSRFGIPTVFVSPEAQSISCGNLFKYFYCTPR